MLERFNDFYDAYKFLSNHTLVHKHPEHKFEECLSVEVVKVCPDTLKIEEDDALNTLTQVWLEFGPYDFEERIVCHDLNLDCGANTYEEAIIKLANLVDIYYNEDGTLKEVSKSTVKNVCYAVHTKEDNFIGLILIETYVYDEYSRETGINYTLLNQDIYANQPTLTLEELHTNYKLIELKSSVTLLEGECACG